MNAGQVRRLPRAAGVILLLVLLCVLALFSGCGEAEEKQPQYSFVAQVEAMTDTTMRVTVTFSDADEVRQGQAFTLSTKTLSESELEHVVVGSLVTVVMADPMEADAGQPIVPYSIRYNDIQPR